MRNRAADWRLELTEFEPTVTVRLIYQGMSRSFELKPGESLDLRVWNSHGCGPAIIFQGHKPNSL